MGAGMKIKVKQLHQDAILPRHATPGAARINDLRQQGHHIETRDRHLPNGKVVAEYHLKEKAAC